MSPEPYVPASPEARFSLAISIIRREIGTLIHEAWTETDEQRAELARLQDMRLSLRPEDTAAVARILAGDLS